MKFPVIPLVCMALLLPFPLSGQEAVQDKGEAEISGEGPVFFPVYALLSALGTAELRWRPDWPVTMPPDAFIVENGRPRSVTIMTDSGELRAARDQNGSPLDFPFFFQGDFVQVHVDFAEPIGIRSLTIDDPPGPWNIDFPEGDDPALRIARISQGDDFFFGAIQETLAGDTPGGIETWYDRDGNPLAVFTFRFTRDGQGILRVHHDAGGETTEEQYWDSFGNISGIVSDGGVFSAVYTRDGRPR
jgi:YD repeat-containing protein